MELNSIAIRAMTFDSVGDADSERIPVVCSTDAPVDMGDVVEVLVHDERALDLSRAPLPIIATHRGNQINVGVIEDIVIQAGQMRGYARFGKRQEAADYETDVRNKIIRSVSVGYQRVKSQFRNDNVLVTTRWQPTHVAMVAEPADVGAGFYRAANLVQATITAEEFQSGERQADIDAPTAGESQPSEGERRMNQAVATPADTTTATRTVDVQVTGPDPLVVERERARDIRAIGRQFNMVDLADQHIDSGTSVDNFRSLVLSKLKDNGQLRVAESPEVGLSEREVQSYSFCRALLAAQDPANARKIAPFEMEVSDAAQAKRDDTDPRVKERMGAGAITLAVDVLNRGMNVQSNQAAAMARALAARVSRSSAEMQSYFRDLTVGAQTGGGNLVATELLGSSFIDLLRNAMILDRLGITMLRDLNGNIAIPSQTGAATGYWVAEGGAPTESQQTIGQMPLTPKTVGAFTDFTRRLLLQSSLDVELFVRMDLARVLGLEVQNGAFNGTGASNQPFGLFNIVGIGSVAMGANGGVPTYDIAVDLESKLADSNADVGNLAYVTNSKVRGKLRKTQVFTGTNGQPVWTSGRERGIGEVLGYDAYVTNTVPSNLTKGTASGICSAAAFGNWGDFVAGFWGGVDLMLDPYANATSGGKRVIALQDVDFNVRNLASFAVVKDILTT